MENKCPKCGSVIYSRKNVLCGVCGERLPSELLFNSEQKQKVDADYREARKRAMREAQSSGLGGPTDPPIGGISSTDFGSV